MKCMVFLLIFLSFITSAFATYPSAIRDPRKSYESYESEALLHSEEDDNKSASLMRKTALRAAQYFSLTALPEATRWKKSALQERFETLRDYRSLDNGSRRPSWFYPDDGCYSRAAILNQSAFRIYVPVPSKVFAFGKLRVSTKNHPRGRVHWWYHVAPIVQVGDEKYVLDPAIELSKPLKLEEWLGKMGTPSKMKVAICGSGTYTPSDSCDKETMGIELRAQRAQAHFLRKEAERMKRFGRLEEL